MGDEANHDTNAAEKPVTFGQLQELLEKQRVDMLGAFDGFKTKINGEVAGHRKTIEALERSVGGKATAGGVTAPDAAPKGETPKGPTFDDLRHVRLAEALRMSIPEAARTKLDEQLRAKGDVAPSAEYAFWEQAKAMSEMLAPASPEGGEQGARGPKITTTARGSGSGTRSTVTLPTTREEWRKLPIEQQRKILVEDIAAGGNFDPDLLPRAR